MVLGRCCGLICVKYWIGWSCARMDGRFHCKILWNKDLGRRCFVARGARSDPGGGATAGSLRGWISRTLSHCGFFGILSKGCSSQGLRFLLWKAVEISQLSLGHFCGLPSSISSAERCGSLMTSTCRLSTGTSCRLAPFTLRTPGGAEQPRTQPLIDPAKGF